MTVRLRREFDRIDEEVQRRNAFASENVVWYQFVPFGPDGSEYDEIFDTPKVGAGGRKYLRGVNIPTIYAEEVEDESRAIDTGRQPTQNVKLTFRLTDMEMAGISDAEEYRPHLNDVFKYDGRVYEVYRYSVRGRMEHEQILVTVEGIEVYTEQEYVFDDDKTPPLDHEWPDSFRVLV